MAPVCHGAGKTKSPNQRKEHEDANQTTTNPGRIEAAGIEFAYLFWHEPTGRIMTIPVGDD